MCKLTVAVGLRYMDIKKEEEKKKKEGMARDGFELIRACQLLVEMTDSSAELYRSYSLPASGIYTI
jgi:hypothetical protein